MEFANLNEFAKYLLGRGGNLLSFTPAIELEIRNPSISFFVHEVKYFKKNSELVIELYLYSYDQWGPDHTATIHIPLREV